MAEEIKAEFIRSGFSLDKEEEEEVISKCHAFCINLDLSPSDLVSSWEIHYLNRQLNHSVVHNAEMDAFLLHLENQKRDRLLLLKKQTDYYSFTDVHQALQPATTHPTNATPFAQRKSKFSVLSTGSSDLPNNRNIKIQQNSQDYIIQRVQPTQRCSLFVHPSHLQPGCRALYDRIQDRYNFLEARIEEHSSAFAASSMYEEPVDPTIASQKSMFAVGMVYCDGEGRLNEKSILLQSSGQLSGGQRVKVDLQKLSQFSIFPGQVLGIEGNNPSGHCLIASKIVDFIPLPVSTDVNLHPAKKQALDQELQSTEPSDKLAKLSLIIAAGPFTTNDNLLFEPLSELLAYASRMLPQLLILVGPFVDSEHPEIKRDVVDRTYDEIFRIEVLRRLQDHVEYIGSAAQVIVVPSIRDANHQFVFPQPPFDIHPPDLKDQITSLGNPGIFEANEVKVGCCSVDILKHLSGEIISRKPSDGSAWDGRSILAHHILGQRSFYPLYPPAESVPLDLSLASKTIHMSRVPDILILPSDIAHFVKVVSLDEGGSGSEVKCICVNPGRLAKGEKGGSFVELNYNKNPDCSTASIINI